jgi:lipid-A-disaccharide synthase-like uncharacterized protein
MLDEFLRQIYDEPVWFTIGMTAQLAFFFRFFVQWVVSERRRQSVVPNVFWYLSLAGGVLLLIYSIHKRDTVFTVGSILGCFVYARNLRLVHLEKVREAESE